MLQKMITSLFIYKNADVEQIIKFFWNNPESHKYYCLLMSIMFSRYVLKNSIRVLIVQYIPIITQNSVFMLCVKEV